MSFSRASFNRILETGKGIRQIVIIVAMEDLIFPKFVGASLETIFWININVEIEYSSKF